MQSLKSRSLGSAFARPIPAARPQLYTQAGKGGFGKPSKQELAESTRACPCGSGKLYNDCCKPYQVSAEGKFELKPPDAETCLRARFSAYKVKSYVPLIVKTTATDNPARKGSVDADGKVVRTFEEDIKASFGWMSYRGLKVLSKQQESPTQVVLDIEYDIQQKFELRSGRPVAKPTWQTIKETSVFVKEGDAWVFKGAQSTNWDRNKLQVVS